MSSASDLDSSLEPAAAMSGEIAREREPVDGGTLLPLPPGAMLGGCEILRMIGAGAYGEVYLGADTSDRRWALKRLQLLHKDDRKARQRFLQEAKILHFVKHPNVVMCDGYGAERSGDLWMRLEYLEGATLRDVLHAEGSMSVERALRLGRQVCQGLAVLHRLGAVHRDLKPENLFLTEDDLLKVLDFGLVKIAGSACKTTGRIALGTALYFAPDYLERDSVHEGDAPDPRWDVYSLGMTLYELMVGHPFVLALGKMPAPMVAAKMHLNGEVRPIAEHGIPEDVAAVVMKAVARDPAQRYADAVELERALREVHERRLADHLRETPPPRTATAKVRLGDATTEPDVAQHLARAAERAAARVSAPPAPAEQANDGQPRVLPAVPAMVATPVMTGAQERDARGDAASATNGGSTAGSMPRPPGVDATMRLALPPAAQRTEPLDRAQLRTGKVLPFMRPEEGGAPRGHAVAPPAARTEELPRAGMQDAQERADVDERARTDERPDAERGRAKNPVFADEAPLPADPEARDAAEIALWLKQGYLPPEVARKLGLNAAATAPSRGEPAQEQGSSARDEDGAGARGRAAGEHGPGRRALAAALFLVIGGLCAAVVLLAARRSREASGPAVVPVATASPASSEASGRPPEPARAGDVNAPGASSNAGAATAEVAPDASGGAPPGGAVSGGGAMVAASPTWTTPPPKSSRANDIYPTLEDEDPGVAAPKPAAPQVTAAPKLAAPKPAVARPAAPKPTATSAAKKPARLPAGPSPFED